MKIYKELHPGEIVRLHEDIACGRRLIVRVIVADNNGRYRDDIVEVETARGTRIACCRYEVRLNKLATAKWKQLCQPPTS